MFMTKEAKRTFLSFMVEKLVGEEELRKRRSRRVGEGLYRSVQNGKITPERAWEVINRVKHYADPYQVRIGYRRSQASYRAEVQRLTNHSHRRPH